MKKFTLVLLVAAMILGGLSASCVPAGPPPAEEHFKRGVTLYKQGLLDEAINEFTMAIELDSKLAEAYSNCGAAYADKGNLDQAIADFTKAIELDPNYVKAYNNRGFNYMMKAAFELDKGNIDLSFAYSNKAIADFDKVIELNPDVIGKII